MSAAKILRLPPGTPPPVEEMMAQDILEDYVDHLCAPLVALVPYPERKRLKQETLDSLEGRMEDFVARGEDECAAAQKAIEKYGSSVVVGNEFLETWMRHQPTSQLGRLIGIPNSWALVFFGQATLWSIVIVEMRVFLPSATGSNIFGIPYGDIRKLIPQPIPIPDGNLATNLFLAFVLIAPFIAGWLTGRQAILSAARASYNILVWLTLASFALGVALLPAYECLFLACALMFWWLPMGCLSAHIAAALAWRRRCAYHSFPRRKL